jgi:hypothetical protein
MVLRQIGILTLAKSDDTNTFDEFRKRLHVKYVEGKDVSLHFRFANGDNSKLSALAQQLLDIPVEVIVTAGTRALNAVAALNPSIRIIQAVGGEDPGAANRTGFHINVLKMCRDQFVDLRGKGITELTILHDSTSQSTNANDPFPVVKADATNAGITVHEIDAKNPTELAAKLTAAAVKGGFMLIPNGWFFDHCKFIAETVDAAILNDASIWAIYPEREYVNAHPHANHVLIRGHKIPKAYKDAADHVDDFLTAKPVKPSKEADSDP